MSCRLAGLWISHRLDYIIIRNREGIESKIYLAAQVSDELLFGRVSASDKVRRRRAGTTAGEGREGDGRSNLWHDRVGRHLGRIR